MKTKTCRYNATKATVIALLMTFFRIFDVPVFWPILLIYFCALFFITMKRQIKHMIKYKYLPWSRGKKTYTKKQPLDAPGKGKGKGDSI